VVRIVQRDKTMKSVKNMKPNLDGLHGLHGFSLGDFYIRRV
jgi:hypothetical protein